METMTCTRTAVFSVDEKYRYILRITVNPHGNGDCLFVMLNPSTATEKDDDPTVAKCQKYARRWGYETLTVVNLFAYRATDPQTLGDMMIEPVGGETNDNFIREASLDADIVICAWGAHGNRMGRASDVLRDVLTRPLYYLHLNQDGTPGHPLYLKDSAEPIMWPAYK